MRVQFLGTGASPSTPQPFCECEACITARSAGGKNLRRRSSLIVNNDLLIDLGPDVVSSSFEHGVSLVGITHCLQTHPHGDHFDPELLISRHPEWGTRLAGPLSLAGSQATLNALDDLCRQRCGHGSLFDSRAQHDLKLELTAVAPFDSCMIGSYVVTPYPANHAAEFDALLYTVTDGASSLFYATDTSVIADSVWRHMSERGVQLDVVILDHTYGIGFESSDHLGADDFARSVRTLKQLDILKQGGKVYATHLSHEGIMEHDAMEEFASCNEYHIAYDGLVVRV